MDQVTNAKLVASLSTGRLVLLPPESPLDMPVQPLHLPRLRARTRDVMTWPRAALMALTVVAVGAFARLLYEVLSVVQLTALQAVFLVLSTLCFAWIALGSSSALLGFVARWHPAAGGHHDQVPPTEASRTALLFPIYQEDVAHLAATIEAIAAELIEMQAEQRFDIFVLSDSRASDVKGRELRAVRLLRKHLGDKLAIFYRAREQNIGKKAGNIADWVRRFGGAYGSFVILDADSVMSGRLLLLLQSLMDAQSTTGLIQTVPRLVGANALLARLQQFAVAYYGPIVAAGFAAWYQRSGNYWGHNAIVRTRAFAEASGLPVLHGRAPFGGHVLSHDFAEAAFLRRAGWEVEMRPDLIGSYEGCPPTLVDLAVRDRRWAQGNVQHLRTPTRSDSAQSAEAK